MSPYSNGKEVGGKPGRRSEQVKKNLFLAEKIVEKLYCGCSRLSGGYPRSRGQLGKRKKGYKKKEVG